jgi:hypothetical protein
MRADGRAATTATEGPLLAAFGEQFVSTYVANNKHAEVGWFPREGHNLEVGDARSYRIVGGYDGERSRAAGESFRIRSATGRKLVHWC